MWSGWRRRGCALVFSGDSGNNGGLMPGRGEWDPEGLLERELTEMRELVEPAGAGSASLLVVDENLALADRSRARVRGTQTPLEDLGLVAFAASTAIHCARIDVLAGDLSTAEEELRRAYDALASIDEKYLLPPIAELLAQVVYAQGRLHEAEEISRAAETLAASDDLELQALWPSVHGTALAWQERADEADRRAREAVDLIRIRAALSRLATWHSQSASGNSDRSTADRRAWQAREPVVTAPGLTRERFLRDILANKKLPDGYARKVALETLDIPAELFAKMISSKDQPADASADGSPLKRP
jgi:tetratricopeptide (TPR) repeat protein